MNEEEIKQTLDLHSKWLAKEEGGVRANLNGADLSGAYLSRTNLCWANLSKAYLYGANLREANLSGASLSRANLCWASLSGAYLYGANLYRADLSGADLIGADLSGANLAQVQGVRVADCQWSAHGAFGRRITAVELPTGLQFYCGCFDGSEAQLRAFIDGSNPTLKSSRLKALDFLLSCF